MELGIRGQKETKNIQDVEHKLSSLRGEMNNANN